MTYRGKVLGGVIVPEEGARLPEGSEVRIEIDVRAEASVGSDPLFSMADLAVETGVPDLATNADHYLYGHPKATDAK